MRRKKLRYHYDRAADVMYFYLDRLRKAKTIELNYAQTKPAYERGLTVC
jgi:hypothetical protein